MILDRNTKLGRYFALWEATQSSTAARLGIPNQPNAEQFANLRRTALSIMDPIRVEFGPIRVTSGLRVPELNRRIPGSSPTSAHQHGLAWDFQPLRPDVPLSDVMNWIVAQMFGLRLPIDRVIYEYARWIHVAGAPEGQRPRREARMKFSGDVYRLWDPKDERVTW